MNMRYLGIVAAVAVCLAVAGTAGATGYTVGDGFETAWTGDYASGWVNVVYRHGTASSPSMTQYSTVTANGHTITPASGSYFMGLKVTAAGDPVASTNWWGAVVPTFVAGDALARQYSPWVSVSFYDYGVALPSPQLAVVPDSGDPADWTDIQFGQRWNRTDHYWFAECMNSPSAWIETSVARSVGWHELKLAQNTAGYVTYYIDGTALGTTTNAYLDLGSPDLMTQFADGEFGASEVYFDNFQAGSTVPEPVTMAGLMLGIGCLARYVRNRKR